MAVRRLGAAWMFVGWVERRCKKMEGEKASGDGQAESTRRENGKREFGFDSGVYDLDERGDFLNTMTMRGPY